MTSHQILFSGENIDVLSGLGRDSDLVTITLIFLDVCRGVFRIVILMENPVYGKVVLSIREHVILQYFAITKSVLDVLHFD